MAAFGVGGRIGGSFFRTTTFSDVDIITSGQAAGTILTLTPPSGQRVIVTGIGASADQDVELRIDAVSITSGLLGDQSSTGSGKWFIKTGGNATFGGTSADTIGGDIDEPMTIVAAVMTTSDITITYQFGEQL